MGVVMTFALVKNGSFLRLITDSGWVELNGNDRVSPPIVGWTGESDGDQFAIMAFQPFVVPEGKWRTGEPSYAIEDGKVIETCSVEDFITPAPQSITPAQAKAQLYEMGLLDDAEALVASHPYALVRIYWNSALQFDRDNAYIAALAYELGIDDQLDDLFRTASQRTF